MHAVIHMPDLDLGQVFIIHKASALRSSWSQAYHNQRTNDPVNAHLISSPSTAQNIQNLVNVW